MRRADADGRHDGTTGVAKVARDGEQHQRAAGGGPQGPRDAKPVAGETHEKAVGKPKDVHGPYTDDDQTQVENQKQRLIYVLLPIT